MRRVTVEGALGAVILVVESREIVLHCATSAFVVVGFKPPPHNVNQDVHLVNSSIHDNHDIHE